MLHRPVLLSAPAMLPVSLDEVKARLRVDVDEDHGDIERMVRAAVSHLDGWSGILGGCMVEQQWRQDFDCWEKYMRLPLGPVISVDSVSWRNRTTDGVTTIGASNYSLRTDPGGRPYIRFINSFARPGPLAEIAAISVTFTAGYATTPAVPADGDTPAVPAQSTVPDDLKGAILFHVGHLYENREAVNIGNITSMLPLGYDSLVEKYRRTGI